MSSTPPPTMSAPPPPPPEGTSSSKKGCLIAAIIVVLVLLLGCGGACVWTIRHPGRVAAMGLGKGRADMMAAVASDVPEDKRAAFGTEYDAYVEFLRGLDMAAIKARGQDAEKLFAPARYIGEAAGDKALSQEEVDRFIELSQAARGAAAP